MMRTRLAPEHRRFVLFLLAGAVNTAFGYSAFALLILLRLPLAVAAVGAAVAGVLFNFRSFGMVFQDRDYRRLPRFVAAYAVLIALNLGALHLLIGMGVVPLLAEAFVLPALALLSYLLMRRFVFVQLPLREFSR